MNIWKSLGNGFYENLVPVHEKTTSRIYPAAFFRNLEARITALESKLKNA